MTPQQRLALEVLAEQDEPIEGWKRRTTRTPFPRLNMRAASSLCEQGLARCHWPDPLTRGPWSVFVHENKYSITDAGLAALDG